jgi:RNA polymerase sigma-70 factor (ECF subfamily)
MTPDEVQLIQRAKCGDPVALNTLLMRYIAFVQRAAERIVHNSTDAADITQEVLIKAVTALPALQAAEKFQGWIYRITYRTSLNWLRALHRRPEHGEERVDDLPSVDDTDNLVREEQLARLITAFQTLPCSQRIVIKLFYFEGRPIREIAEMLGLSEVGVKVQLHRIRTALRRQIEDTAASS